MPSQRSSPAHSCADEVIKRPIAIKDIRVRSIASPIPLTLQQRLDAGDYPNVAAVKQDLDQMCAQRASGTD